MDLGIIITAIIGFFTTVGGSVTTWFLGRKKYNSEVDQSNIKNMQEALEFYKTISDDYKKRLEEEIQSHNAEVEELKKESAELRRENIELKKELREQEKKFDSMLMAQQRDITLMKNQMLSVYSQVCLNFNCMERTATKELPIGKASTKKSSKKTQKTEDKPEAV